MAESAIWTYPNHVWMGEDLVDFSVEAIDGSVGSVDAATYEVEGSYLVVDTGTWIFGKKVLLPAGIVDRIEAADKKISVARTKDEIKNAPEYDADRFDEIAYRAELGRYYGLGGEGAGTTSTTVGASRRS